MVHALAALSRIRASDGYERVVRDLGCVWFLLLATVAAWVTCARLKTLRSADLTLPEIANFTSSLCVISIYVSLAWLILHRPSSVARTKGILPSVTALIGTYLPWSFILLSVDRDPRGLNALSLAFLVTGAAGTVVVIAYLGKSFSIIPQARRLVREGPYSVVRHPLYLAEEVALLSCLLRFFSPVTLALFLVHGALQIARIRFEENLLRSAFPDYEEYARSTSRLIPHVW
jgi:Isoprenylcysteine carboxyl methyltransferase (ICMT) family